MQTLNLPGRFNGPPTTANGGYAAGRLAALVDADAVTVRLRRPPRLDAELVVRRARDAVELLDGDELVARAEPGAFAGDVPPAPRVDAARDAQAARPPRDQHPFPACFGCGPARPAGESVAALLGPLPDRDAWAGTWTPTDLLPHAGGHVADAIVWVALDCPGAQPVAPDDGPAHVLGTLTAQLLEPVALDAEHVLLAWQIGEREGRKARTGSAVLRADGTLCARAEALWIALG